MTNHTDLLRRALELLEHLQSYFIHEGGYEPNIEILLPDLRTAIEAGGWLPISEAPKDGSTLECWDGKYLAHCCWAHNRWNVVHDAEDDTWYGYSPTHWMPLPAPPVAESNHGGE